MLGYKGKSVLERRCLVREEAKVPPGGAASFFREVRRRLKALFKNAMPKCKAQMPAMCAEMQLGAFQTMVHCPLPLFQPFLAEWHGMPPQGEGKVSVWEGASKACPSSGKGEGHRMSHAAPAL